MSSYYNKEGRTRVRRHAERGRYDAETVEAILDEGLVGHLAFVDDGQPYAIPMLYVRRGETLYLHGSPQSRLLGVAGAAVPVSFTVTLIDGLVLARSAFHHSVNYRSAVVLGSGRRVEDRREQLEAMRLLVDHIVPGRADDARGPSDGELRATGIVSLEIAEASAKVRTGPPLDSKADHALPVWAGELPLALAPGPPRPDAGNVAELPGYLQDLGPRPWTRTEGDLIRT